MNLNKFKNFIFKENSIRYVILLAWVLRFILFLVSQLWVENNVLKENYVGADSEGYHVLAINLLHTGSYETMGTFRTPGYPTIIAFFYNLFGYKPWIVIFFQIIIDLFSVFLVYLLGKTIFDSKIGLIAALLYALDPHLILFSTTLQSDTLFVFFFLGSMLLFFKSLKKESIRLMVFSGLVLGIATLVRPITQFFPFVLLLLLFFNKATVRFRVISALVLMGGFALSISPWIYRNFKQFNSPSLSSIQGANLLFYSAAYAEVVKTGKDIKQVRKEFSALAASKGADERYNPVFPLTEEELWNYGSNILRDHHNPFKNSAIYNKIASEYIKNNLKYYIPRHIQGIINMFLALESRGISYRLGLNTNTFKFDYFAAPNVFYMIKNFIYSKPIGGLLVGALVAIFMIANYLLFFFGSYRMYLEKNYYYLFALICVIGYYSAVVGVVGLSRYKMPIIPFYSLISAYGIYNILIWYRKGARKKTLRSPVAY